MMKKERLLKEASEKAKSQDGKSIKDVLLEMESSNSELH
jgi:hypothetical protein